MIVGKRQRICACLTRGGIAAGEIGDGGLTNGRYFFFAWGGGTMSHPPVLLIEDDCVA